MASLDQEEETYPEYEIGHRFNTEGPQPYSFEPAARGENRSNRANLNGERRAIETWEHENAHRLENANW